MKKKRKTNKYLVRKILSPYPNSDGYGLGGNFGSPNMLEQNPILLKQLMQENFQDSGDIWNVKTDAWAGKNRQGVIRRFRGGDSKQRARSWARDSVYKTPEKRGHEIAKDVEVGSDHKPHDIKKSTSEDRDTSFIKELSPKTLGNYIKKSNDDIAKLKQRQGALIATDKHKKLYEPYGTKSIKRRNGIHTAVDKLAHTSNEENENIFERNYKREYELYHSKPTQVKRRAQRNSARRKMERVGRVKKGDGKDVHHRDRNTSNNSSKNLSVTSKSYNRSKNK